MGIGLKLLVATVLISSGFLGELSFLEWVGIGLITLFVIIK